MKQQTGYIRIWLSFAVNGTAFLPRYVIFSSSVSLPIFIKQNSHHFHIQAIVFADARSGTNDVFLRQPPNLASRFVSIVIIYVYILDGWKLLEIPVKPSINGLVVY